MADQTDEIVGDVDADMKEFEREHLSDEKLAASNAEMEAHLKATEADLTAFLNTFGEKAA